MSDNAASRSSVKDNAGSPEGAERDATLCRMCGKPLSAPEHDIMDGPPGTHYFRAHPPALRSGREKDAGRGWRPVSEASDGDRGWIVSRHEYGDREGEARLVGRDWHWIEHTDSHAGGIVGGPPSHYIPLPPPPSEVNP